MSVFSYINELLIFQKSGSGVFFPKIVMSAFADLVSFLCPDVICQMMGSKIGRTSVANRIEHEKKIMYFPIC